MEITLNGKKTELEKEMSVTDFIQNLSGKKYDSSRCCCFN